MKESKRRDVWGEENSRAHKKKKKKNYLNAFSVMMQVGKAFEYQGKSIEENIKNLVLSELDQAKAVAGGWKMPFFLFFFIVVAGGGYAFYKWRNWEKKL